MTSQRVWPWSVVPSMPSVLGGLIALATGCTTVPDRSDDSGESAIPAERQQVEAGAPAPVGASVRCATPPCADGEACSAAVDCTSHVCLDGSCQAPSGSDGVRNGSETDIDCGGPAAKRCSAGRVCTVPTDCESDGCAYNGRCAISRSCTRNHGGDTCGALESDEPGAAQTHESCCLAPEVPANPALGTSAYRLDKYGVTAGRMRAFVESTQGDMLGYIQVHRPSWWDADWDKALPRSLGEAYWALGPGDDAAVQDNPAVKVEKRGCYQTPASYNTFRLPEAFIAAAGLPAQAYPEDVLDEKALNCATLPVMAAFCAWDGGYVPSAYEIGAAWGPERYPWGAGPGGTNGAPVSPPPAISEYAIWSTCLQESVGRGTVTSGPLTLHFCSENDLAHVYHYPPSGLAASGIAAPGRRPKGNGPFGHADLIGNLAPMLAGDGYFKAAVGSWQGHFNTWDTGALGTLGNSSAPLWRVEVPKDLPRKPQTTFTAYWASGARCARPL